MSRLTAADVGAWLFRCSPAAWDGIGERVDGWCARPTYRLGLVRPGCPAVLWVTGAAGRRPSPGLWMARPTTGDVDERDPCRPRIGLRLVRLTAAVRREEIAADPRSAGAEVLRVPQGSNPSFLTPAETAAVAELMTASWPSPGEW